MRNEAMNVNTVKREFQNIEVLRKLKQGVISNDFKAYTGWGGLREAIYTPHIYRQLKSILNDAEINNIKETLGNAYYTPAPMVKAVYDVVQKLGFKGGSILEPAAGNGVFIENMPAKMKANSKITAVEIEQFSAKILSTLYPDIQVHQQGFETLNLATDLVITTDKNRIYNISLTTTDSNYVRQVVFYYPTDTSLAITNAQANAVSQANQQSQAVTLVNGTSINLNNVNFNYKISGDDPTWKPMRAFDDGKHTIIQFPAIVNSTELPALFVLNNGQDQLVNFRKQSEDNGTVDYVVDQIFTQAVLVTGVGSDQTKVVITNQNLDHSWF